MQWFVASANTLQPLGKARDAKRAPNSCFQSGPNLYCTDTYELGSVTTTIVSDQTTGKS